jgi:hypothetical protein
MYRISLLVSAKLRICFASLGLYHLFLTTVSQHCQNTTLSQLNTVTTLSQHNTTLSQHYHNTTLSQLNTVTTQHCHNSTVTTLSQHSQHNTVTTQHCHNSTLSQHCHNTVTTQHCHNTTLSQHNTVTTLSQHNTVTTQHCHNTVTTVTKQHCHNSKCLIFQERLLKVSKCYNFLWVQWRHNCSPAASFPNCIMTLYLLKVRLQTFHSIPIAQKCQILSCATLVTNERYNTLIFVEPSGHYIRSLCKIATRYYELHHDCPSVRPSWWNNSAPIERMKFDILIDYDCLIDWLIYWLIDRSMIDWSIN